MNLQNNLINYYGWYFSKVKHSIRIESFKARAISLLVAIIESCIVSIVNIFSDSLFFNLHPVWFLAPILILSLINIFGADFWERVNIASNSEYSLKQNVFYVCFSVFPFLLLYASIFLF